MTRISKIHYVKPKGIDMKFAKFLAVFSVSSFFLQSPQLLADESNPYKAFNVRAESTHDISLVNHGMASLEERLRLIESATKSIDVEYFIYNADISGKIFTQALINKAKEGVKVRVLLDYFMIKDQINTFMIHELKKEGIEIRYYNPVSSIRFIKVQYRNHRKVLLIDGEVAMTGGRNIGNEYFDLSPEFNFIDRDVVVRGEIVKSIAESFEVVWNSEEVREKKRPSEPSPNDAKYGRNNDSYQFDDFEYKHDLKKFEKRVNDAKTFIYSDVDTDKLSQIRENGSLALREEYTGKCESMEFLSEYPIASSKVKKQRVLKHNLFERIKNVNEKVLIDSPYFIIDDESGDAFKTALSRGKEVELLTNGLNSTDAIYVYAVFETIVKEWIDLGLKPYMYLGHVPQNYVTLTSEISPKTRFGVHAKTLVFDNKDVTIGTFNFDPRSYNFNTEMVVTCNNNPEFAEVVSKDIHHRMESSVFLDSTKTVNDYEFYEINSLGKKITYWLLKIPSNLLDHLL